MKKYSKYRTDLEEKHQQSSTLTTTTHTVHIRLIYNNIHPPVPVHIFNDFVYIEYIAVLNVNIDSNVDSVSLCSVESSTFLVVFILLYILYCIGKLVEMAHS